ncbi:hypothetical protein EVJ58_g6211 [Rhodofomes roseus]|uniref:Zinc finger C3HC4 RING-type domain-containing protein n=1 Tax=Rhodofomes roseus TaxID=34475 RepID=A0A4Y9Y996_9APHY|nr:hypothetical protein EVJ58_g6211 [Rhodofomes roseus]
MSQRLNVPAEAAAMNLDADDTIIAQSASEAAAGPLSVHGDARSSFPDAGDARSGRDMVPGSNDLDSASPTFPSAVVLNTGWVTESPGQAMEAESSAMAQQRNMIIDVDALMDELPIAGPSSAARNPGPRSRPSAVAHAVSSSQSTAREQADGSGPRGDEPLSAYSCPICFSPPVRATMTPCGHVCCGECLFTAIKTTMQRASYTAPVGERLIAR